jgi:hypothetical protein
MLLSAALYALVGKAGLPSAAIAVSAAALAVQAYLLYLLVRRTLPVTAVAIALLTLAGAASPYSFLALETMTVAALVLAAVWAVDRERPLAGGLLTGLAFLARHDVALLVPILLLAYRHPGDGRRGLRFLAAAAAPVVPWILFASLYYGSPLPRTLGAKQGLAALGEYLAVYGEQIFRLPGLPATPATHAAAALLALLGLAVVVRRLRALRPYYGFALALLVAYLWLRPPAGQTWHLYPVVLALRTAMVAGPLALLEAPFAAGEPARRPAWRRRAAATLALLCLLVLGSEAVERSVGQRTDPWRGERHRRYEQAAAWMLEHAGPDRSLLAIEVGTLGYLTGYEMIDPFGLVTPTAGDAESADHVVDLMRTLRPDLVLVHSPIQGRWLEETTPYRTIRVFPWLNPWSTLLARDPSVLRDRDELPRLRSGLDAYRMPDGSSLDWPRVDGWRGAPPAQPRR